jgi:hypothetical protein
MTLTFTTDINDITYYIEAEVSLRHDNLGVPHSDFTETVIDSVLVYDEATEQRVDLEANKAFKRMVYDHVIAESESFPW